jgi:hypothetical protein
MCDDDAGRGDEDRVNDADGDAANGDNDANSRENIVEGLERDAMCKGKARPEHLPRTVRSKIFFVYSHQGDSTPTKCRREGAVKSAEKSTPNLPLSIQSSDFLSLRFLPGHRCLYWTTVEIWHSQTRIIRFQQIASPQNFRFG